MINVAGTIRRAYLFPADRPTAFEYYRDLGRLLQHLPHIEMVHDYGDGQFRVLYSTVELGAYHIHIYADVQASLNEKEWALRVNPMKGTLKVSPKSGLNWSTAQGKFASEHYFHGAGDDSRIEYVLQLQARLPTPLGLPLMPGGTVDYVAESIVQKRMREISNGFVERSIAAFPDWLEKSSFWPNRSSGHAAGDGPPREADTEATWWLNAPDGLPEF